MMTGGETTWTEVVQAHYDVTQVVQAHYDVTEVVQAHSNTAVW